MSLQRGGVGVGSALLLLFGLLSGLGLVMAVVGMLFLLVMMVSVTVVEMVVYGGGGYVGGSGNVCGEAAGLGGNCVRWRLQVG